MSTVSQIDIKDRHVDQLTAILVETVKRLQDAPLTIGHPYINTTVESLDIENVALDLQLTENDRDEDGRFNPNLAGCVMDALRNAFLKTGRKIYDGPDERILTYDPATHTISSEQVKPDDISPLTDPNVVNIGGTISQHDVLSLGIMGHDLEGSLSRLTEPVLREAARETIAQRLQEITRPEIIIYAQRLERAGSSPYRGGNRTEPAQREGGWADNQ